MLVMPGSHIAFPRMKPKCEHGIDFLLLDSAAPLLHRTRLKFDLTCLRQFDPFERAKHAILVDRVNGLHVAS